MFTVGCGILTVPKTGQCNRDVSPTMGPKNPWECGALRGIRDTSLRPMNSREYQIDVYISTKAAKN
jgi:hypothetical protein